jgi:hypothetical protein
MSLSQIASPELTQMQESSECVDSETTNAETEEEFAEKQEKEYQNAHLGYIKQRTIYLPR